MIILGFSVNEYKYMSFSIIHKYDLLWRPKAEIGDGSGGGAQNGF